MSSLYATLSGHPRSQPVLMLIHGAGGSRLSWPPALRRMSGMAVYTLDLPGHGRSSAPPCESVEAYAAAVLHFMEERQLPPAILVGHSMGSAIALTLALRAPQRVAALVLIGSGARLRVHPSLLQSTASENSLPQAIQTLLEWAFSPETPAGLKALAARHMGQTPASTFHADFLACDRFDLREHLHLIPHPTLLLCGSEDRMTPPRFSEFLAERLPHARLQLFPGAGHMLPLERPQQVAQALQEFIQAFPPSIPHPAETP